MLIEIYALLNTGFSDPGIIPRRIISDQPKTVKRQLIGDLEKTGNQPLKLQTLDNTDRKPPSP